jgi:hypothetical protein
MEIKEDAGGEASQVKLLNRVMSIQQTSCFICGKQDKKINMGNPKTQGPASFIDALLLRRV